MNTFDALAPALEDWFASPLCDLPDVLRQRVAQEFFPMPWDRLSPEQRRSVALQMDYLHDPATEQDRNYWLNFFERVDGLREQVEQWKSVSTPTATELALQETRLAELNQELARMDAQKRIARGDYHPERKPTLPKDGESSRGTAAAFSYFAYPKAMRRLSERLDATPQEMAAWVFIGPKDGGLAAYVNANELDPPPRFFYATGGYGHDYIAPLMGCWFKVDDVEKFEPADRYIVGAALIERWSKRPGLHAEAFILAKIAESRLLDIHPIYGGTRGTFSEQSDWPPLESGLFALTEVEHIEAEDFDEVKEADQSESPEVGTTEWRRQNAQAAANALHDQPGGSRDKQNQIRKIWASGKYSSRDVCAEQECAALDMSFSVARKALIKTPEPSRC